MMPRWAPHAVALRPGPWRWSRRWPTPPDDGRQPERECAILAAQLEALEQDIATTRQTARRVASHTGPDLHARAEPIYLPPRGQPVQLPDGAQILIRQIEPEDAPQLKTAFEHLGAVSRYRRFLTPIDHLTTHQLAYLTHVDHRAHEALVALDATTGGWVGTARYVRDAGDRRQAEMAVIVTGSWQRRGVATALIERLSSQARATGIRRFTARMLTGNRAARRLLAQIADSLAEYEDAGTIHVTARLRP